MKSAALAEAGIGAAAAAMISRGQAVLQHQKSGSGLLIALVSFRPGRWIRLIAAR